MKFSYMLASENEILAHIENASPASVSAVKAYHEKAGNTDIVSKINDARKKIKDVNLVKRLERLISG